MKQLGEFLKTTIMGGLLVLFPLIACLFVILKIGELLTSFIKPLLSFVPQTRLIGVAVADVASVLILILLCFIAGLFMKTSLGGVLGTRVSKLLDKIPGYNVFVRVSRIVFDRDDASGTPVVVQRGENRQLGFMMEETDTEELQYSSPMRQACFQALSRLSKPRTCND